MIHKPLIEHLWDAKYGETWQGGKQQGDVFLNGPAPTEADLLIEDPASHELCKVSVIPAAAVIDD